MKEVQRVSMKEANYWTGVVDITRSIPIIHIWQLITKSAVAFKDFNLQQGI